MYIGGKRFSVTCEVGSPHYCRTLKNDETSNLQDKRVFLSLLCHMCDSFQLKSLRGPTQNAKVDYCHGGRRNINKTVHPSKDKR